MDKNEIDRAVQDQQDVLVVDDNPESLQLLKDILNKAGYHVRPAPNGIIALRSVGFKPPDLIILDVKMPDMDGYEVCRHLKSDEKSRNIPVIFISGLGETAQKVRGFNAGGVDYITKPFEAEEISTCKYTSVFTRIDRATGAKSVDTGRGTLVRITVLVGVSFLTRGSSSWT